MLLFKQKKKLEYLVVICIRLCQFNSKHEKVLRRENEKILQINIFDIKMS